MTCRQGASLVEVLVAIFITAIGLLALLALFPLGALSMAQAIKDERAAEAAQNARAIAKFRDIRHDPQVWSALGTPPPGYPVPPPGPSYPVYVDPFGWQVSRPASDPRLGSPATGIRRQTVSWLGSNQDIVRWFTLLDDITFGDNGIPPGSVVDRAGRYSWAYLVRQVKYTPSIGLPPVFLNSPVDLTVVVYEGRSLQLAPSGQPAGESRYAAKFSGNVAVLTWDPTKNEAEPDIRKGMWILDATVPTQMQPTLPMEGFFYRVVGVTQPGSSGTNSIDLELQTNVRDAVTARTGTAVVMESVAEVFEMGPN